MPLPPAFQLAGREVWYTAPPDQAVSDAALIQCTKRWLQSDGVPANTIIPFVIIPLTLEWEEFRRFMCRVNAHARYLYIVRNGNVEELELVLRQLREAVSSERLIISHRPDNIGYAAAVNEGYRVALAKPYSEVPFIGVFNCDVYFEKSFFRRYVPDVYKALAPDADRIYALEEEVRKEENAARTAGVTTLRAASADIPGISLSLMLPDRVRYAPLEVQQREFNQHVGMFHFHYQCMCAFFVSRLALLAGGFLDENCYPAYFEDYDWRFRMTRLGFRTFIGPSERYGGFYHGLGGNIRVIREGAEGRSLSYDVEAMRVSRMLIAKPGIDYGETKWAWHREALIPMSLRSFPTVGFAVPPDAWVMDQRRRERIVGIGRGLYPAVEMRNAYNLTLLEALRPFDRTR
ncbi:beta-galactofuranosyltransferase-like protein (LPG1R) [Leptomonas pyrrhocoris]|uniref:Beta-galactofuranosyltransferase-like protein (LPG1R) n=1 Tax=Leptomonas pyrrhocoris TaxID=157538 RepID=A0A0M9FVB1_LEPPY|nr:beta-galactofuranosyltransferase-like protein (LPG1R) [Leptomonas pyrrhocoris]KPA76805.1 beta-galactofuranosyltransferase-like protein (LPG1R) [Leptomonas pyrrhocoris]|eukprot:XP_015655244.1 beta-galactofuranosyltransferase-like protein (LPG1R) [Leptomonas pyrrhocoris]